MQHKNNFDFLRLLAAFAVLYSHQHALVGLPEPTLGLPDSLGAFGVSIFFSISGYLIAQSWERDPNLLRFATKRVLRIWPALLVVTVLAAFVLGPIVSDLPVATYFQDPLVWKYLDNLRLRMTFQLPGVFTTNPFPNSVNGSTWTIPVEVRWYVYLSIAGALGLLRKRLVVLLAVFSLAGYYFGIYKADTNPVRLYATQYGLYF
ncbi:acyltransferase [Burkholderia cenocepacia]|nr:acyltransferase [Burkholderia cenocepacia]